MQTVPRIPAKDKARALRQQIDDRLDTLASAIDEVRASETFRQYLEVQARFHKYSWHNTLLILSQRPDASRVAGFKAWQKLGRHVKKGERGIMIFAPRPFHKEIERGDGTTEERDGIYFLGKTAHSFRHHFCTDLLKRGAQLHEAKALMRHRDVRSTMVYSHATVDDLRAAVNRRVG